jgi:hypothetical protein
VDAAEVGAGLANHIAQLRGHLSFSESRHCAARHLYWPQRDACRNE